MNSFVTLLNTVKVFTNLVNVSKVSLTHHADTIGCLTTISVQVHMATFRSSGYVDYCVNG